MGFLSIDYIIVVLFLTLMLIMGLAFCGKIKSLKDYALGAGQFGSVILFSTLSATVVGGYRIMGIAGAIYDNGLVYFFTSLGTVIGFAFTLWFVIPKLDKRFDGKLSIADIMGSFYGNTSKRITAIFGTINCIAILCIQFTALGSLLSSFLNIPFVYALIIPSSILIFYSSIGGIKSVIMTDFIQFCIFIIMVPLLAKFCIDSNGGITHIFNQIPSEKTMLLSHPKFFGFLFLFVSSTLPFSILDPALTQRFLMLKPPFPAKPIIISFIMVMLLISVMTFLIAFAVLSSHPNLPPNQIVIEAIKFYLPVGLKGFMIAGLLAAIMSTADSVLNVASVLTAQLFNMEKGQHASKLKFITLGIAFTALACSIKNFSLIYLMIIADIILIVFVSVPLFFTICRCNISKKTYYQACIITSLVLVILASLKVHVSYLPLVGVAVSSFILLRKHLVKLSVNRLINFVIKKKIFF